MICKDITTETPAHNTQKNWVDGALESRKDGHAVGY